jgi:hypothetical protein
MRRGPGGCGGDGVANTDPDGALMIVLPGGGLLRAVPMTRHHREAL